MVIEEIEGLCQLEGVFSYERRLLRAHTRGESNCGRGNERLECGTAGNSGVAHVTMSALGRLRVESLCKGPGRKAPPRRPTGGSRPAVWPA